jgi:hypothetical protein
MKTLGVDALLEILTLHPPNTTDKINQVCVLGLTASVV